ncbi:MAG TPA: hypothetical protein VF698_07360, partial [Thermoanaerobaculia bacterium]
MITRTEERRRYGRIALDEPLAGQLGDVRVRVIEVSVVGFRVAHEARLMPLPSYPLLVNWDGRELRMNVSIIRTTLTRLAKNANERSVYHSGLRIENRNESDRMLRELIAHRVMRALDEQKANAHGIPPLAAYMYQPGKGDRYRRCELVDGIWRKSETSRPVQPLNGFTISADVPPNY